MNPFRVIASRFPLAEVIPIKIEALSDREKVWEWLNECNLIGPLRVDTSYEEIQIMWDDNPGSPEIELPLIWVLRQLEVEGKLTIRATEFTTYYTKAQS